MLNDDKAENLKDALEAGYPLLTSSRAGLMYQNEYRGNLTTDSRETLFSVVPIGACTYRHMSDDDVFCAEQKKGGTRTRLCYNALCELKMMVPSQREQDVIAVFF